MIQLCKELPDGEEPRDHGSACLGARDATAVRKVHAVLRAISRVYYRSRVEGVEHLSDHASLIVATHNGIWHLADVVVLIEAFWSRFGPDTPSYGMIHEVLMRLPGLGPLMRRLGGLPASPENGLAALRADSPVLVCPGGDNDAMKPFRQRHTIQFGRRRGFMRLALRAQVPIIPVVSVGAHETIFVLNDGRFLAKLLGFDRMFRIKSIPITLSFPFGLTLAGIPSLPLPSKVVVRILPPMTFDEPPSAADNPAIVERCHQRLHAVMQAALTDLASKRRRVFFG